jgi:hypothetical protein
MRLYAESAATRRRGSGSADKGRLLSSKMKIAQKRITVLGYLPPGLRRLVAIGIRLGGGRATSSPPPSPASEVMMTGRPIKVTGRPLEVTGRPLEVTGRPLEVTGRPLPVTGVPAEVGMKTLSSPAPAAPS